MALIKGIRFEPDTPSGVMWFNNYSWQRPEVLAELDSLHSKIPTLTHIVILLCSSWNLSWPLPTSQEIANLNQFLLDANSYGFKVIIHLSTPGIISNPYATSIGEGPNHVGGHKAGDVVNNWTLVWDIPYFSDDIDSPYSTAKEWNRSIISSIDPSNRPYLEYIEIGGHHRIPFGAESNLLYSESQSKAKVALYHTTIANTFKQVDPTIKSSSSLVCSTWKTGDPIYDQPTYAVSNITTVNYYSFAAIYPQVDMIKLTAIVPSSKLILTDLRMTLGPSRHTTLLWWLAMAEMYNVSGWWLWQYRERDIHGGVRKLNRDGGAWDEGLVSLLKGM